MTTDKLRLLIEAGLTPEQAIEKLHADLDADALWEIACPVLLWRLRTIERSMTRRTEREVGQTLRSLLPGSTMERAAIRARLAKDWFSLPNGEKVAWLDATAIQHRDRADYLRRQAKAVEITAEMHMEAARDIEVAGVKCLRELEAA